MLPAPALHLPHDAARPRSWVDPDIYSPPIAWNPPQTLDASLPRRSQHERGFTPPAHAWGGPTDSDVRARDADLHSQPFAEYLLAPHMGDAFCAGPPYAALREHPQYGFAAYPGPCSDATDSGSDSASPPEYLDRDRDASASVDGGSDHGYSPPGTRSGSGSAYSYEEARPGSGSTYSYEEARPGSGSTYSYEDTRPGSGSAYSYELNPMRAPAPAAACADLCLPPVFPAQAEFAYSYYDGCNTMQRPPSPPALRRNTWGYPAHGPSVPVPVPGPGVLRFVEQGARARHAPPFGAYPHAFDPRARVPDAAADALALGDPSRWPQTFTLARPHDKRTDPKKQVMACLFCRTRKIGCVRPPWDAPDQTCNQCARRKRSLCHYPTESRRGHHARDRMNARKFLGYQKSDNSAQDKTADAPASSPRPSPVSQDS